MGLLSLVRRGRYERVGFELYGTAVAAARDPYLYTELQVPDTLDGRFDMIESLQYISLLIQRLKREPAPGPALAQAVFDAMFSDMDINLREMGVGDLSVGAQGPRDVGSLSRASRGIRNGDGCRRYGRAGCGARTERVARQSAARLHDRGAPARHARAGGTAFGARSGVPGSRQRPFSVRGRGQPMTTELSRLIGLSKIGAHGVTIVVRATPEECAALAVRMDLPAIQFLECRFALRRDTGSDSVLAEGHLQAEVTQVCVASAEEFIAQVEEAFTIRFVPAGTERDDPDPALPDEIPYDADTIELGEATAEQLGLALDPWPRIPGATVPMIDDAGETLQPFAALAQRFGQNRSKP